MPKFDGARLKKVAVTQLLFLTFDFPYGVVAIANTGDLFLRSLFWYFHQKNI
ncbi:hypothetical protein [Nostoc sp. T09]|uniref:hypothetical protein n=1 Tax=Nostoc sp. T09 TaxID=1932621 RepID=UPI0015C4F92F|nr:hypothetical protein [Nostoc sp. T09]